MLQTKCIDTTPITHCNLLFCVRAPVHPVRSFPNQQTGLAGQHAGLGTDAVGCGWQRCCKRAATQRVLVNLSAAFSDLLDLNCSSHALVEVLLESGEKNIEKSYKPSEIWRVELGGGVHFQLRSCCALQCF